MTEKRKKPWALLLFSLPFAGAGIGILLLSVIPSLYEGMQMQGWPVTQARVLSAELKTHSGDSTTYEAIGRYEYDVAGRSYTGTRLGISTTADNIGDWHQQMSSRLHQAQRNGSTVSIHYNPEDPTQSIVDPRLRWGLIGFMMIFVLVFGGVGIGMFWWGMRNRARVIDTPEAASRPWLGHSDWSSPTVRSDAKRTFYVAWGMALVWNLISSPVLFAIPEEWNKGNHAILVAALFPLVGLGLLAWAVRVTRRWRAVGPTPLTLDPYPGSIGGQVGGVIDTNIPFRQGHRFAVVLSCVYSYMTGSGKDRKRSERVEWSAEGYAQAEPAGRGSRLSFRFDVPDGLPASEPAAERYHLWRLNLSSTGTPHEIDRNFELPVFATGETSRELRQDSASHPLAREERDERIYAVMDMQQTADGVALDFPTGRNLGFNSVFALMGLLFLGGGLFAGHLGAPLLLVIVFCVVGGGIALGGLYALLNRLEVRLGPQAIHTRRSLLGVVIRKSSTPTSQVRTLRIHRTGSMTSGSKHRVYHAIRAHLVNGKTVTVAESLVGHGAALEVAEALALYGGLELDTRVATVRQIRKERRSGE